MLYAMNLISIVGGGGELRQKITLVLFFIFAHHSLAFDFLCDMVLDFFSARFRRIQNKTKKFIIYALIVTWDGYETNEKSCFVKLGYKN